MLRIMLKTLDRKKVHFILFPLSYISLYIILLFCSFKFYNNLGILSNTVSIVENKCKYWHATQIEKPRKKEEEFRSSNDESYKTRAQSELWTQDWMKNQLKQSNWFKVAEDSHTNIIHSNWNLLHSFLSNSKSILHIF